MRRRQVLRSICNEKRMRYHKFAMMVFALVITSKTERRRLTGTRSTGGATSGERGYAKF
jgi:hypothetical protein